MYEWLIDYQKLTDEIDYLEFSIDRNETELKRWVEGDLQDVPLQRESLGANVEEVIIKLKQELEIKIDQRKRLIYLVDNFKGLDHKILKLKYVDGVTLEVTAEQLNYSASYIYKKHAEIIKRIKFADQVKLSLY